MMILMYKIYDSIRTFCFYHSQALWNLSWWTEMLVVGLLTDGSGREKRAEPAGFYILFSRIRSEIPMRWGLEAVRACRANMWWSVVVFESDVMDMLMSVKDLPNTCHGLNHRFFTWLQHLLYILCLTQAAHEQLYSQELKVIEVWWPVKHSYVGWWV